MLEMLSEYDCALLYTSWQRNNCLLMFWSDVFVDVGAVLI